MEERAGPEAEAIERTRRRLEHWRRNLIDLSLRNRLLNFRPTAATTVRIVEEFPAEVYRVFAAERRKLGFLPRRPDEAPAAADGGGTGPERGTRRAEPPGGTPPAGEDGRAAAGGQGGPAGPTAHVEGEGIAPWASAEPSAEPPQAGDTKPRSETAEPAPEAPAARPAAKPEPPPSLPPRPPEAPAFELAPEFTREFRPYDPELLAAEYRDRKLQTDLEPDRLDYNLLRIHQRAASILEEQGYNVLFLALGALEWRAPERPDRPLVAPLVLVPAELVRKSPRRPFLLVPADDDPVVNPALAMRLEREFGIRLGEPPEDPATWDLQAFLASLAETVKELPGWRVLNDIHLSLFSFAKSVLYQDLEANEARFAAHSVIRALAGDPVPREPPRLEAPLDEIFTPGSSHQVLDADSSQREAIAAVLSGSDLVIEGPPGTGKSQTIANLIAEVLARGERVLFVSEKMAALEVVHRRLRQVGLGDFTLELHSRHASKREVVAELERTLGLPRDGGLRPREEEDLRRLAELQAELNAYVEALSRPEPPFGLSPAAAIDRLAELSEAPDVPWALEGALGWTRERFEEACERLDRYAEAVAELETRGRPPQENPWRGAALESLDRAGELRIRAALEEAREALDELTRAAGDAAARLEEAPPVNMAEAQVLPEVIALLAESPRPPRTALEHPIWRSGDREPESLLAKVAEYRRIEETLTARWRPELLEVDLQALHERIRGRGPLAFLTPSWWRDRALLKTCLRPGARLPRRDALLGDLEAARRLRELRRELVRAGNRARVFFASLWEGPESDPPRLEAWCRWMRAFAPHLEGPGADGRVALAEGGLEAPGEALGAAKALREAARAFTAAWGRLAASLKLDSAGAFGAPLETVPLAVLRERLDAMRSSFDTLYPWTRYVTARAKLTEAGLESFIARAEESGVPPPALRSAFERVFHRTRLDEIAAQRPPLAAFTRSRHERLVREFCELDVRQLEIARRRLRAFLLGRLPDSAWEPTAGSELGILLREVRRKRGHRPLRKLFRDIPHVLARLKPCLLMSPLSVAQFLDPDLEPFDLVIFDEASQIPPEDAIGAIARARRVVVVGDRRQLPPTSFFRTELVSEEEEEGLPADLESILDECVSAGLPRVLLRWHYRSRDESLITFSNRRFYDGRLFTFPAPGRNGTAPDGEELGVHFVHVEEGVYDRGRTQTNLPEARRVAAAVIEHFRAHPHLSLGVGTFSQAQQLAILDLLEEYRRRDESLEPFFSEAREEHFFVKNLENIQGDERDVIFISVGYGRDTAGRFYHGFGPLNAPGGERRLNVLVTRARRRLVVFSSIRAEMIDPARTSARGALLLREFLSYAERGGLVDEGRGGSFMRNGRGLAGTAARALEACGLRAESEVGSSELKIDIGVREGEANSYLLGIECDTGSYLRHATARDRERLRRQVLEGLGWRLGRLWGLEWARTPPAEIDRLRELAEAAKAGRLEAEVLPLVARPQAAAQAEPAEGGSTPPQEGEAPPEGARAGVAPYAVAGLPPAPAHLAIEGAPEEVYLRLIEVVDIEWPIHRREAARRIAACWRIERLSPAVERVVEAAVEKARAAGRIEVRGEFLWKPGAGRPVPRARSGRGVPRAPGKIALEELAEAVKIVLEREFAVPREELVPRVARLLGYGRTGSRLARRIEEAVRRLLEAGELCERAGRLELSRRRGAGPQRDTG